MHHLWKARRGDTKTPREKLSDMTEVSWGSMWQGLKRKPNVQNPNPMLQPQNQLSSLILN